MWGRLKRNLPEDLRKSQVRDSLNNKNKQAQMIKTKIPGRIQGNSVLRTQACSCTYEDAVVGTMCTSPMKAQTSPNRSMESTGGHGFPSLAEALLATDASFWHREVFKNVALVCWSQFSGRLHIHVCMGSKNWTWWVKKRTQSRLGKGVDLEGVEGEKWIHSKLIAQTTQRN